MNCRHLTIGTVGVRDRALAVSSAETETRALHGHRRGFTLVELLVVIAIIGILVALLLPAIQAAREAARRSQCKNNVKNIALGCLLHEDTHKCLPSGGWGRYWVGDPNRGYGASQPGSWLFNILTYVEEGAVHDLAKGLTPGSAAYKTAIEKTNQTPIALFHCPTRRTPRLYLANWGATAGGLPSMDNLSKSSGVVKSDYAANSGDSAFFSGDVGDGWTSPLSYAEAATAAWTPTNCAKTLSNGTPANKWCQTGVMFYRSEVKISQVTDGTTSTYLVGEKCLFPDAYGGVPAGNTLSGFTYGDNQGAYSGYEWDNHRVAYRPNVSTGAPEFYQPQQDRPLYEPPSRYAFGSAHSSGMNMAMCDGSVHFLSYDIDVTLHRYLANRLDGNVASLESP